MPNKKMEPYKVFFETLSNRVRWNIIHLLLEEEEMRVTDIVEVLDYEQSLISHHLSRLNMCGFVSFSKKGNERIYKINEETTKPLLKLMDKHINKYCKDCVKKIEKSYVKKSA